MCCETNFADHVSYKRQSRRNILSTSYIEVFVFLMCIPVVVHVPSHESLVHECVMAYFKMYMFIFPSIKFLFRSFNISALYIGFNAFFLHGFC